MSDKKLQAIPLGGVGEFGMNIMALRYGDDIIVIDCGLMFPEAELLGVDIVVPDITYLLENREHVRAILLTHGHEDHIGALPFVLSDLNVPVYGTPFTLALAERRLEEHALLDKVDLREIRPKEKVDIGPFKVEYIHVTHSIVSAAMLAITTPLGVVMHTGDFKVDPTPTDNELFDLHTVAGYGQRGVLALFSDSTNVERRGYTPSERAVRGRFEEIFHEADHQFRPSSATRGGSGPRTWPQSGAGWAEHDPGFRNRPRHGVPADSRWRVDAPAGHRRKQPQESRCADLRQSGRADVRPFAGRGGQPQARGNRGRRPRGALVPHHSGKRKIHLPDDQPLVQT